MKPFFLVFTWISGQKCSICIVFLVFTKFSHLNNIVVEVHLPQLWRVKKERAPIAVNWLGCAVYKLLWSVDLTSYRLELSFVCGYFHASFPHRHWIKQELRQTSPFLKAVVGRGLLTSSRAPTIQSRRGHQLWRGERERASIAVNRLGCAVYELLWSVDLTSYRLT